MPAGTGARSMVGMSPNPFSRAATSCFSRTLIAAATVAAFAPSAASAIVVTYEGPVDNEVLVVRAAPGEVNQQGVQVGPIADSVSLYDSQNTITQVPHQCRDNREYHSIDCHAPNGVRLELGDGNDRSYVSSDVTVAVTAYGGPGNDSLDGNNAVNTFFGEAGDDVLSGSGGDDVLDGGDGNDTIDGYSGSDRIAGGAGDDLIHPDSFETPSADVVDGGPGVDRIESDYVTRNPDAPKPPSTFTLAGGADDGRPGEGDDIRNVERLMLSQSASFTGTDAAEYVKLHQVGDSGTLIGMGGDDELRGGDGADTIDGGAGADLLDGGYGDDTITGGPGRDRISADLATGDCGPYWCKYPYGNDTVLARDGEIDSITCGAGTDRVVADADDVVAPDCETVERTSAPVAKPGEGSGPVVTAGPVGKPSARMRFTLPAGQRLRTALRRGLRVRVSGARAGTTVKVRAVVGRRTVASGSGKAGSTVLLRFTKPARRTLAAKRSVRLKLVAGTTATTVTLKR